MSRRRPRHRTTVEKRNLHGARMWWMTCTCGWFSGFHDKGRTKQYASDHEDKFKGAEQA